MTMKEHFLESCEAIDSLTKEVSKIATVFPGWDGYLGWEVSEKLIESLSRELNDDAGWIYWWIAENNLGRAGRSFSIYDKKFTPKTSDEFFDIMIQNERFILEDENSSEREQGDYCYECGLDDVCSGNCNDMYEQGSCFGEWMADAEECAFCDMSSDCYEDKKKQLGYDSGCLTCCKKCDSFYKDFTTKGEK